MKKLLLIIAILTIGSANAQWKKNFYVDEFGEKTGESYEYLQAFGTFSNSATQNSKAKYDFIKSEDSVIINVYEYERSLATSIDPTFETVKIRTPSKEVVVIKKVFFSKSGKLLFSKELYKQLIGAIQEKGDYIMIFDRGGSYSKSSYKIKFTIE